MTPVIHLDAGKDTVCQCETEPEMDFSDDVNTVTCVACLRQALIAAREQAAAPPERTSCERCGGCGYVQSMTKVCAACDGAGWLPPRNKKEA